MPDEDIRRVWAAALASFRRFMNRLTGNNATGNHAIGNGKEDE